VRYGVSCLPVAEAQRRHNYCDWSFSAGSLSSRIGRTITLYKLRIGEFGVLVD